MVKCGTYITGILVVLCFAVIQVSFFSHWSFMLDTLSFVVCCWNGPDLTDVLPLVSNEKSAVGRVDVITEELAVVHGDVVDNLNLRSILAGVGALVDQVVSAVDVTCWWWWCWLGGCLGCRGGRLGCWSTQNGQDLQA